MKEDTIHSITDTYCLLSGNDLEEYRCKSFFTKEPETVAWINTMDRQRAVFYDIGANVGIYTLYAAQQFPGIRIYGFEPYLGNYIRLCENIRLNNAGNVVPLQLALSGAPGIERFYVRDDRVGSSGNQVGENRDERGQLFSPIQTDFVLMDSLDHFIHEYSLPSPTHIKIDVDGAEGKIVAGMEKTLQHPALESVLIEINHTVPDAGEILRHMERVGFTRENPLNALPDHSRFRRKGTASENAENIILTRRPSTKGEQTRRLSER